MEIALKISFKLKSKRFAVMFALLPINTIYYNQFTLDVP